MRITGQFVIVDRRGQIAFGDAICTARGALLRRDVVQGPRTGPYQSTRSTGSADKPERKCGGDR